MYVMTDRPLKSTDARIESGPRCSVIHGAGFPLRTQLRKNQKDPVAASATHQRPASRGRRERSAYQTTPMVNPITGTTTVNFVESASPAATPASAVGTTSP